VWEDPWLAWNNLTAAGPQRNGFRTGFLSALEPFHPPERFVGALALLLGEGDCRDDSAVEGSVAWCLLLVEHVLAEVLGSLVVVELGLVCVVPVLSETQFGLTTIDRGDRGMVIVIAGGAVGVERYLCFVEALLVAVGNDLFASGDALG
jgi:hypothetical protein